MGGESVIDFVFELMSDFFFELGNLPVVTLVMFWMFCKDYLFFLVLHRATKIFIASTRSRVIPLHRFSLLEPLHPKNTAEVGDESAWLSPKKK